MTLFADVAATTIAVGATRSRSAKIAALADLLARCADDELNLVTHLLCGQVRQGRIGVGWATSYGATGSPASTPTLAVHDIDHLFDRLAATTGTGSVGARTGLLEHALARATEPEQDLLRRLLVGELRTGALAGVVTEAVARATGTPVDLVRRAAMLTGDLGVCAHLARIGGADALARANLVTGRPVMPMLAGTAPSVTAALEELGLASVEWKLDGARVQIHRRDDEVSIFTRNLNEITGRLPGVVAMARSLPVREVVLDAEVLGLDADGRPGRFQDTMSSFGSDGAAPGLRAFVFDVLRVDDTDLLDDPLQRRLDVLDAIAGPHRLPHLVTADPAEAERFADRALAAGHEGVMVKALDAPYEAGRRGTHWRKVKPVRTLDLVVLAAEWGHGRRTGWLSNLHLGARGAPGEFVMVGKTFKGLTDELLTWQTAQLQARAIADDGHVVHVRPELVVEIAVDGVQASRRYPGGVALRFARVKRYRPDKNAHAADPIEVVQAMLA